MDPEREAIEDANAEASENPAEQAEGNVDETPDSQHTNGDAEFANGAEDGGEGVAENEAEGAVPEEGGDAMDIDEGIGENTSYIGDNCISTPAHTESNSPSEEQDQEMIEAGSGEVEEGAADTHQGASPERGLDEEAHQGITEGGTDSIMGEGSPDQSVSSNTTTDQDVSGKDIQSTGDVASSDDVSPSGVVSSATTLQASSNQQETSQLLLKLPIDSTLQNPGITSNTLDGTSTISSSSAHQEESLCSSTNTMPLSNISNSAADTSALTPSQDLAGLDQAQIASQLHTQCQQQHLVTNSSNMTVSSTDMPMLQPQVSSTCSGNEDSSVTSNTNTNNTSSTSTGPESNGIIGGDALATLASAALNRQNSQNLEKEEEPWYTVGIVKGTTFTVHDYIVDPKLDLSGLTIDNIPDLSRYQTAPLEPGTGYKFRVAAINSCGRGDFGEESPFKTCVPGYPGAPSDIKISKSAEGAHLSWEPPQASPEGIFEYSVYLAVRPLNPAKTISDTTKSQLTFVRVYCGKETWCVVGQGSLVNAHVDSSTKPAIIFRIAARNDKGYGPATQVRWLQENKSNTAKRLMDGRPQAPPPKQAKPLH